LLLANYVAGFLTTVIQEANIIVELIKTFTPFRDWTAQYHSVGKYNSFKSVPNNGNKIRRISASSYLKGENSLISEASETVPGQVSTVKLNNWKRESSVYLKYSGQPFPDASSTSGIVD